MLTEEQLALRKTGVTATDLGAILGLNPYKTAYDVYLDKTTDNAAPDLTDNNAVYWGIKLEPLIAERYATQNKVELEEVGTIRSKEHDFLLCTPDRIVKGTKKGLEIKTAGINSVSQWAESVPPHYFMQAAMCMFVLDFEAWDMCCLLAGQDMRTYTLMRDPDFDKIILDACTHFWFEHVKKLQPPPLSYSHPLALETLKKIYPDVIDNSIDLSVDVQETVERWQNNKQLAMQYQKAADAEQALILDIMGNNGVGLLPNGNKLIRKEVKRAAYEVKESSYVTLSYKVGKKK